MKISAKQYAETLYELTLNKSEAEIDAVIKKFIEKLSDNRHIKFASKILEKFEDIYNEKNQIISAQIITTREINAEQEASIKQFLKEKYTATDIKLNYKIDKSIKGGIIIRVGDDVLDGSVSGKLRKLSLLLKKS